jgi:hypothetical protein
MTKTLLAAIAIAAPVLSAAQSTGIRANAIVHGFYQINVNQVANPGFETLPLSPWNGDGSYINTEDGDQVMEWFGLRSTSHHAGKYCYDFNVGEGNYGAFYDSQLNQTLAYPVAGSAVTNAYVYVQADYQDLGLEIIYTDNTSKYGTFHAEADEAPMGANGWQKWDFSSLINPNKTIKEIQFSSYSGYGSDIKIDDVTITVLEWVYL